MVDGPAATQVTPRSAQYDPVPSTHRRTVRIVGRRRPSRTATVSLIVAGMTAAGVFGIWRVWHSGEARLEPYVRTIFDTELRWRCEAGHLFEAPGQIEPRHCWKCGGIAYPVTQYRCPTHGAFEAAVQFASDPDGTVRPAQLRFRGDSWLPAEDHPACPRCGQPMELVPVHSLTGIRPEQAEPGGRYIGPP